MFQALTELLQEVRTVAVKIDTHHVQEVIKHYQEALTHDELLQTENKKQVEQIEKLERQLVAVKAEIDKYKWAAVERGSSLAGAENDKGRLEYKLKQSTKDLAGLVPVQEQLKELKAKLEPLGEPSDKLLVIPRWPMT